MGYTILERNFRRSSGEIDIIAQKDDCLVFTEVKLRQTESYGLPCEAVTLSKQKRIIETAKYYIFENDITALTICFDVAEILVKQGKYFFRYIQNAFDEK